MPALSCPMRIFCRGPMSSHSTWSGSDIERADAHSFILHSTTHLSIFYPFLFVLLPFPPFLPVRLPYALPLPLPARPIFLPSIRSPVLPAFLLTTIPLPLIQRHTRSSKPPVLPVTRVYRSYLELVDLAALEVVRLSPELELVGLAVVPVQHQEHVGVGPGPPHVTSVHGHLIRHLWESPATHTSHTTSYSKHPDWTPLSLNRLIPIREILHLDLTKQTACEFK